MENKLFEGFTEEQIEKARACHSMQELFTLAKNEGVELTEEQLAAVTGGCGASDKTACPRCHGHNTREVKNDKGLILEVFCKDCQKSFKFD